MKHVNLYTLYGSLVVTTHPERFLCSFYNLQMLMDSPEIKYMSWFIGEKSSRKNVNFAMDDHADNRINEKLKFQQPF
jgi:hypothetical protein